ncbi:MAG: hypothetical protein OEW67_15120 [Cyclobacteriaceae bacterium]|nr:hypothetical protein [Cyclobacteriaceae bacterium]
MKPKLIILSDLWGLEKSQWIDYYKNNLQNSFEIKCYDSCELGQLDQSIYSEEALHKQFINGGIEIGVQNLLKKEKDDATILGFSVGGTIGWKYGIARSGIKSLYAVSSTRLRYEVNKPRGNIALYFGSEDNYKPTKDWCNKMNVACIEEIDKGHQVYMESDFAKKLCKKIINAFALS